MNTALDTLKKLNIAAESPQASYRTPPHNYEAEQGVLGAILINNDAFERTAEILRPEMFADAVHGRIYQAAKTLIERGHMANPVTLKNFFDQDNTLADIGGAKYLKELAEAVVSVVNVRDYARTIHEMFLRRQLIGIGTDVVNEAYEHALDNPAEKQVEAAEKHLYDLVTTGDSRQGFRGFDNVVTAAVEMAEAAYKRAGKHTGLTSGLVDLDQLLGGFNKSDLLILAGRPSMGKTALATNIAFQIAKDASNPKTEDGGKVGFFSLEMSAEQLALRMLSEHAKVPSEKIRKGTLNSADVSKIISASKDLAQMPLFIDDTPALTVSGLRARARRLKRQHGLDFIVVDYLQLIGSEGGNSQTNRVQEVSEITRGLKTLAKELEVPVVALSQLSRQVENRDDKRPQLSDLRESGSIEQDADIVMFIYRQEYYLEREEPNKRADEDQQKFNERYANWQQTYSQAVNKADVIVAKQRHGPIGKATLHFDGATTKFSNYVANDHIPDTH